MTQSLPNRSLRPLAIFLLFAWLAYLVTAGQPRFELSVFPATVRMHLLLGALALAYVIYLAVKHRLPGPTRLDLPLACLVVVYILASQGSIYPRVSIEYALLAAAPILAFYAFHDFRFLTVETLVQGLMSVGAVAALAALYQVASDYLDWLRLIDAVDGGFRLSHLAPPAVPRVQGVGGNVNILAMALNLTLPFALLTAIQAQTLKERILGGAIGFIILVALFFTLSRGGWLGTIASLSVFGGIFYLRNRRPSEIFAPLFGNSKRLVVLAAVGAIVFVLAAGLFASRWQSRPDWLFRASFGPRTDAMQVGIDIFRDRPFLGAGPGTYALLYNAYSGAYPVENIHPHNGYLSALDDVGIGGAIAFLATGLALIWSLMLAYRGGDARRRLVVGACTAALASLAVHALLDTPNNWNTAVLPLAVVIALAVRLAPPIAPSWSGIKLGPRILLLALLPALFYAWFRLDERHAHYHLAIGDMLNGRFEQAGDRSYVAAASDSELAAAYIEAGVARAIIYLVQADRKQRTPDPVQLEMAKSYFGTSLLKDPRSAIGHANLALALRMQADSTGKDTFKFDAVQAARHAIFLAPTDGTVAMAAGSVLEWALEKDEAAFAYGRAVARDPNLAQSPYWAANPERTDLRDQALANPEISACEWGRTSAIYAGFRDDMPLLAARCRAEIEASPDDVKRRAAMAIVLQSLGRREEAAQEIEEATRRVPDNPFVLTATGIVRAGAGDMAEARRAFARAAVLRDPYDPDASLLLGYTYAPPSNNTVLRNLRITAEPGPIPDAVVDAMDAAYAHAAPMVFEDGRQRYALGILYYRVRFLRESPSSILVPGEWLGFSSPRALLLAEALKLHRK